MKSLAELAALRQKSLDKLNMRNEDSERGRIVVGMATCGIAAGARPVMNAFVEELNTRNLADVTVGMTGCMGMCALEPMVDVYDKEGNKTVTRKYDAADELVLDADGVAYTYIEYDAWKRPVKETFMDENGELRTNRMKLLNRFVAVFANVADFGKMAKQAK